MDACDVLIAGGGPAGSSCAWRLRQAGLEVVVLDRERFPRDKVCAGWITPQVVEDLSLDIDDYRRGRTFQTITGFCAGTIGGDSEVEIRYDHPVSFGIRRCEFDHYLLQRSGARLRLGEAVTTLRRDGAAWIVNDSIRARVLVGAGGHFCPVARWLNRQPDRADVPLVAAQETEFAVNNAPSYPTDAETPELYFSRDLTGYGWCFRKQDYLNIGFGHFAAGALPHAVAGFVRFLERRGKIPSGRAWRWRGHAYLLRGSRGRQVADAGVVLVGDAAGLAYAQSGEGIRPAIESGLLAAETLIAAGGCYSRAALQPYADRVVGRPALASVAENLVRLVPAAVWSPVAARLLRVPAFVRHVVLDRWFLHAGEAALG